MRVRVKLVFSAVVGVLVLSGCADRYENHSVLATVVDKDYDAATTKTTTTRKDGKTVRKTKNVPAEYDVTLDYNGLQTEIDSKSLYNRVQKGQKIEVTLHQGYDKEGKIVSQTIKLP